MKHSRRALILLPATALLSFWLAMSAPAADPEPKPAPATPSVFDFGHDDPPVGADDLAHRLRAIQSKSPATKPVQAAQSDPPAPGQGRPELSAMARYFVDRAIDAAERDPSARLKTAALCEVVQFQIRNGDAAGARKTYLKLSPLLTQPKYDFVKYIVLQGECGDLEGARRTAEAAIAAARSPSEADAARSWLAVENARHGQIAGAIASAATIPSPIAREIAFKNTICSAVESSGRAAIEKLIGAIADPAVRDEAMSYLVGAEARSGDLLSAITLLDSIHDPKQLALAQLWIAKFQVEAGASRGAIARARDIADPVIHDRALSLIAYALLAANDVPGTLDIAASIDEGPRIFLLERLAATQAENGNTAGARKALDLFPTIGNHSGADYRKTETLSRILAAEGKLAEALATAETIPHGAATASFDYWNALVGIVRAQLRRGDLAGARKLADSLTSEPSMSAFRNTALKAIAEAQAASRDYAGARATALACGKTYSTSVALSHIAAQQVADNDFAGARDTLAMISFPTAQPRAARLVASIAMATHPDTAANLLLGWAPAFTPTVQSALYLGAAEGTLPLVEKQLNFPEAWGIPSW